jgi:hypothetical protein
MSAVIRELDQRTDHGITVTLLWNAQTNRTFVAVVEDTHGVSFEFEVPGTDAAEAFRDPYAYAGHDPQHRARAA